MNIAVIGLGIIGSRMAANWAKAGHAVLGWNRTRATAERTGVPLTETPREAAERSEAIMIVVADPPALDHVLSAPLGVAAASLRGKVVMNAATVGPADNRRAKAAVRRAGGEFVETPFTGSKAAAEAGKLTFFAGGPENTVRRMEPLLLQVGQKVIHFGPVGRGSDAKLIFNLMIANLMEAMAEGFAFARKAGLDPERFMEAYRLNAGHSTLAEMKAPKILTDDFSPHFSLKHMDKDIRLALARAAELGLDLPLTRRLKELFSEAMASGWGDSDFSVLYRQVAEKSGLHSGSAPEHGRRTGHSRMPHPAHTPRDASAPTPHPRRTP